MTNSVSFNLAEDSEGGFGRVDMMHLKGLDPDAPLAKIFEYGAESYQREVYPGDDGTGFPGQVVGGMVHGEKQF
jgi:hypothetical protein